MILNDAAYPGIIFLLITLYSLAFHLFSPSHDQSKSTKRTILLVHYGFCALLLALFVTIFGLGINNVVVSKGYTSYYYGGSTVFALRRMIIAFDALVFVASLEVVIAAIAILIKGGSSGDSKKVSQRHPFNLHNVLMSSDSLESSSWLSPHSPSSSPQHTHLDLTRLICSSATTL